jgi:DNA-binding response OmpR family regulator
MKVLVVEDNPKLQKLLSHILEKDGFTLVTATSGAEALKVYEAEKPDIICLDVVMEDMSGISVCKEIRAKDAKVTILLITSKSRPVDIEEGLAAGANDYVIKPFDLADMTQRMRAIATGRISRDDTALFAKSFDFGDLKVFPGQLRAERAGASIDLNFRDVKLLKLLSENKGKAMGAHDLHPYCWSATSGAEEQTVQWYMGQLRKKVEANPEAPALIKSADSGAFVHG